MELNPDAFEIAHALDLQRSQDNFTLPSPVYGIPFLVKDNIATKDKMQTTAGFWGLIGSVVPRDAHVVKLLREAGALLLGHATLSEWADMRSNSYSEGYSPRGGQARSPYNLTMVSFSILYAIISLFKLLLSSVSLKSITILIMYLFRMAVAPRPEVQVPSQPMKSPSP